MNSGESLSNTTGAGLVSSTSAMLRSLRSVAFRKKTYTLARLAADVAALVRRAGDVAEVNAGMDPRSVSR